MSKKMYAFGCLAPTLKEQGLPLPDKSLAFYDGLSAALNTMLLQRLVTDKEYDRILGRLWKKIEAELLAKKKVKE